MAPAVHISQDGTIACAVQSSMRDYAPQFHSTVDRFGGGGGGGGSAGRGEFEALQPGRYHRGAPGKPGQPETWVAHVPAMQRSMFATARAAPALPFPRSPRFVVRAALDVAPTYRMESDTKLWNRSARSFPKSPRAQPTPRPPCSGNYTPQGPHGAETVRAATACFRSRVGRFGMVRGHSNLT
jgi:hypothetical protein